VTDYHRPDPACEWSLRTSDKTSVVCELALDHDGPHYSRLAGGTRWDPPPPASMDWWWICRCGRKLWEHSTRGTANGREYVCGVNPSGRFESMTAPRLSYDPFGKGLVRGEP
jgi:hypothetical protein